MTINEVAPPGFGHTKGDKEKGVKKGGTAAAFDKARKEGRFKGSKSDMFAIMWSQKKKGDKPHYKPGTNKKFKKYQEEVVDEALISRRKKDWPKGSIDPDDNKMKLAKDLIDLEKQGAPRWTVSQLRAKKMKNEEASIKDPTKKKPKAPQFNAAKELVADAPYMKPALQQKEEVSSYKDYMVQAQAAKDRLKKKIEDRKKKDAQYSDYKAKGVRFYDKKGKGRIVKGRKVYD